MEPSYVYGVRDEPGLEETLELRVCAGELVERLGEDGVRLLAPQEKEELAAKEERDLASADGVGAQHTRLPQVLDRGVASHEGLGRAKLEQHVGALLGGGRLGDCTSKVCDGTLGSS